METDDPLELLLSDTDIVEDDDAEPANANVEHVHAGDENPEEDD